MAVRVQARRVLELDIRVALEKQSFELYYQPLFNLMDHRISSYEALLRWEHPERGFIPPSEFIPAAEEIGLIVPIGDWVLQTACRQCTTWPAHIGVAVNLSSLQFKNGDVVASVRRALKESGLAPNRLELEITESVALQDEDRVRSALRRLQALGVRISFDDFGTGYSSLSYLRNFKLDKIKIDRSFLLDLDTRPESIILLRGISRLSSELGMTVAVEGVETQEQLTLLASVGHIDEVQGFFIGRPAPAGKLEALVEPIGQRVAALR
jgi:EAL domain-containing protein (putative c-di-GMP-specific phosphodiesterase class I)